MPFEIWNRRYTGSKFKLSNWITELIKNNCSGNSFCDIFAGTAIMSQKMLPLMKQIHINDILYSNEIIYNAFFMQQEYNLKKIETYKLKYSNLKSDDLSNNYVSNNFANKYFSFNDAKKIGYIREDIETNASLLNEKEKFILISSLLYSADKSANTVGHYDAYIKGNSLLDRFDFQLVLPYDTSNNKIIITKKDANQLAEEVNCDIVYVDPPYNSRQYSRFYHILENIACWKKPELFGEALKPITENMSAYCRNSATTTFTDLINKLNCNYIVVSYNNTYNSKSSSSRNKIALESIMGILKEKGSLQIFEKYHQFFNAGKTDFFNHKEFIFIVKVGG